MNTTNNQNNVPSNLLSFEGTVLAASYLPVFISPVAQKEQGAITLSNGLSITAKYYNSATVDIIAPIISKSFLQLVFQYVKSLISSFTKEQKLNEIREEFNGFIEKSKKNFECYEELHESALNDMVNDIDTINRQKTLMKDYLLKKLFKKLLEMGIESSFSDFTVEHIDLRDFPINENYNLVQCENLSSINEAKSTLDDIIALVNIINPYFYIFSRLHNNKEIKKIENRLKELEKKENYNTAQMNSDMALLGEFECALRNISCIYKDVMNTLMPIMEKLLTDLAFKYNNDMSAMPSVKVEAIRRIKDILKDLSEVIIVPQKSTIIKMEEEVVNYSNKLSEQHYALKVEMLKAVG